MCYNSAMELTPSAHGDPAEPAQDARGLDWRVLGAALALVALAAAGLWARFGAAVFLDALGTIRSCF